MALVLTVVAALGALVVLLGSALLGSMFMSGSSSDRPVGVVVVVCGVVWAALVPVGWWLATRSQSPSAGLVVLGVHAVLDVGVAILLALAVEAAARP
jgi:hypothetical protein